MFEAHDFYGGQMFGSLRLGASLVSGNEQEGGVHDGGPVQHCRHENVVSGAIDEGHVTAQMVGSTSFGEDICV
jgi:hypothetical protein